MYIIKLNAIDSTNLYLKKMVFEKKALNGTTVVAKKQLAGRGQMGTIWEAEEGKNLTFSTLINFYDFKIENQFYLSMAVSLGVKEVVKSHCNSFIYIKWPNDILADKDKIAGILIENTIRGQFITNSIVGIGLNVNQQYFSKTFGNATSLNIISGKQFDLDDVLHEILNKINYYVEILRQHKFKLLKQHYLSCLYRYQLPSMFEDNQKKIFLGKIIDVYNDGKIGIELEDETIRAFSLKEIKFANFQ